MTLNHIWGAYRPATFLMMGFGDFATMIGFPHSSNTHDMNKEI
jgi:hypothetical protein